MNNFNEMGKVELRLACKEAGIKNYGKMTNDGMRAALTAHHATATATETEVVVDAPEAVLEAALEVLEVLEASMEKEPVARASGGLKIEKNREERNGIKKPSAGGICRAVWDALDALVASGETPTAKSVKALAQEQGWNPNNASIEFYQWRKFHGIRGRQ